MSLFKQEPSLADLQERDETLDTKLSIAQKQAAIRELEERGGRGFWKSFSSNGQKSGIDFGRVINWIKTH